MNATCPKRLPKLVLCLAALLALTTGLPVASKSKTSAAPFHVVASWPLSAGAPEYGLHSPTGIGADALGRVFCCSSSPSYPILSFDAAGHYVNTFGGGHFGEPHSVRVDPQGNVWVVDYVTQEATKFNQDGTILMTLGTHRRIGQDATHFYGPTDIAIAPNGDLYVSDGYWNSRVVHYNANGDYINEWGTFGTAPGQFRLPHAITADAQGRIYVADRQNHRIQVFDGNGALLNVWRVSYYPFSVCIGPDQRLYVASSTNCIMIYDLKGQYLGQFGRSGRGADRFLEPHMVNLDAQGNVYVADVSAHRIVKWARN